MHTEKLNNTHTHKLVRKEREGKRERRRESFADNKIEFSFPRTFKMCHKKYQRWSA